LDWNASKFFYHMIKVKKLLQGRSLELVGFVVIVYCLIHHDDQLFGDFFLCIIIHVIFAFSLVLNRFLKLNICLIVGLEVTFGTCSLGTISFAPSFSRR